MASEFVLGMHGQLEYNGVRLAGMWPHDQVKAVAAAGGDDLRAGRQRQHAQVGGLERGARRHPREEVLRGGRRSPST